MSDTDNIEVRAKEMGWVSKDAFHGDPEKWVDAETYVKRGETFIPYLQATTRRQIEEIERLRGENNQTRTALKAAQESIDALKEFNSAANRKAAKEQRENLVSEIAEASKEGDHEKVAELTVKVAEQTATIAAAEASKPKTNGAPVSEAATGTDYTKTPEFVAWKAENPWFGVDKRKTAVSFAVADELRSNPANANLLGRPFWDKISEEVDRTFGGNQRRQGPSKTEGDTRSTGGGGNGKSFADLPADAKAACEKQASKLVGKDRAFADMGAWRKHYAEKYFEE
jgi:hypothetical protein